MSGNEIVLKRMPRAVLLDFYGTLVEEDGAVIADICRQVAAASREQVAAKAVATLWGRLFSRLCVESFGQAFQTQRQLALQSLRQTLQECGAASLSAEELCQPQFEYWRRPKIQPDAKSVLGDCPVPVCLVSNIDSDDLQAAIEHVGLRFDMVVTSEECRSYKPRPETFRKALATLGLPPEDTLHVGDSLSADVAGARAAGIPVLWINPKGRKSPPELTPEYVSADLTGVLRLFGGKQGARL